MSRKKETLATNYSLGELIVEGIEDKKGIKIVRLDLRDISDAVCNEFIICEGTSTTHVNAIADSVTDKVKKESGEMPFSMEGMRQGEWVLVDYVDTVLHIFTHEKRNFYQLEDLWSDAKIISKSA
ncbi:MAG: ribosome silencing factor [Bacteroidetes bacterium]|nr:ribosome silencing factor [Bacteroidota bacterium]MCB9042263.1 ribosome silencing factor [Chitinophagales bacterium]